MSIAEKLKEIREEIKLQQDDLKNCDYHLNAAISILEGCSVRVTITDKTEWDCNEKAIHPDLPSSTTLTPPIPPMEPLKVEGTHTNSRYKNLTAKSSMMNVLSRRGKPMTAAEVCGKLVAGGWGKDLTDPLASTRAKLSILHKEFDIDMTKIEVDGREINHYSLKRVEDT